MAKLKEVVKTVDKNGDELVLDVMRPSIALTQEADIVRARQWNLYRQKGLPSSNLVATEEEAVKQGLWTDTHKAKAKYLTDQIIAGEQALKSGKKGCSTLWGLPPAQTNDSSTQISVDGVEFEVDSRVGGSAQAIAIQMIRDRIELAKVRSGLNSLTQYTAEAYAETDRFNFLVANCVRYNANPSSPKYLKPYFINELGRPSDVVYLASMEDKATQDVTTAFNKLYYGEVVDYQKKLPEWEFLIKHKMANEKLQLLNKAGEIIGFDGRRIDEDGYYVNEEGKRTDRDGKLLDATGDYIVEYEPFDEEVETGPAPEASPEVSAENS